MTLLLKVEHISYTMGTHGIYTLTLGLQDQVQVHTLYQEKHLCPLYNYYI